jgi:hypothetical protein
MARIARTLLLSIIFLLLLKPAIACNALSSTTKRLVIIAISTVIFLATVSTLTRARTVEIFLAGAT